MAKVANWVYSLYTREAVALRYLHVSKAGRVGIGSTRSCPLNKKARKETKVHKQLEQRRAAKEVMKHLSEKESVYKKNMQ